jgi:hypothetical protein
MGYAISWLAVKEAASKPLLRSLGLTPTGEVADYGESLFTGRELSTGWFILVINRCEHEFLQPKRLESLSSVAEVIACSMEEHVMWSVAELWRGGDQIWRIEHDAQTSMSHISTSGLVPDGYSGIEREFVEKQRQAGGENSDTDYFFEIPLQTAKLIVGFKHDEVGPDDMDFMVFTTKGSSMSTGSNAAQKAKSSWKPW